MENNKKHNQLKGRENYLAWFTRMEGLLTIDGVVQRSTLSENLQILGDTPELKEVNERKAKKYILKNCDDGVMHSINPIDSFDSILKKLNTSYGFGNLDPSIILSQLRDVKFHPSKNPSIILNDIDIKLAELESTGGTITDSQMVQYIHDGLSGDHLRDSFWFNCKGAMNIQGLKNFTVETAGQYIVKFWYAYKPKKISELSNLTGDGETKYEKRFCAHCKKGNRTKIMKTHNTQDCRIFKKENKVNEANNVDSENDNKESSAYVKIKNEKALFHDSGTSRTMLNYEPDNITESNLKIPIYTAGANQKPQFAKSKGTLKFGSVDIDVLTVPTFSKNLLSATQLAINHGCKQVIEPWTAKLKILKNNEVIATGTYDEASKLIKIDQDTSNNVNSKDDWITVHRKLGHVGSSMMDKTLKASSGITLKNKFEVLECEDCPVAKAKRQRISNSKANEKSLLDVVEIDVQGPFPIIANDGTTSNVKAIDSKSNFLYFATVPDTKASTILDEFLKYKSRIERQTGMKIKRVRTDQGVEYMGEFLAYLDLSGIIKEKGVAYTHHHPGKVERAHQTVLRHARSMLKASLLPPKYYDDAQRTAAYIFNRTVHGKDTITPYEHVFKKVPDLKHLRPFGSVCYAFVPPEKRSKLEDSGIRCRLLGYGDDFNLEEIKGYKLLNERDGTIIWSDSVVFDKNLKMEKLDDIFYSNEDCTIKDSLWNPFDQPDQSDTELDEIYFDAEESLTESEMAGMVTELQNMTWKGNH